MKKWSRWVEVVAVVAAVFVGVSAVNLAIHQGSWEPIVSVGWIPAVMVAVWPRRGRTCLRGRQAG